MNTLNNNFIVATIADLHINAFKAQDIYKEIESCLFEYLNNHHCDMIVFAGDYYDSIISHNSKIAHLSMLVIKNIIQIAKDRNIRYVRMIKGTDSHDNNQLINFKIFENGEVDFRIIDTCTTETLDGVKILYIPEEYMSDQDCFYKEFFDDTYDMIFGHGMFRETSFQAQKQEGAVTLSKAPVFNSTDMLKICSGPIIFGHIHSKCTIKERIIYVGSFSRHVYGEEEDKGFLITVFNKETKNFNNEFIINTLAPRYDTCKFLNLEPYANSPETLIEAIKNFKVDNLRVQLILESSEKYCSYIVGVIRDYFSNDKHIKVEIIDKQREIKRIEMEQKVDDVLEKYGFVFDRIPREEKISRFIKIRDDFNIDPSEVKEILGI